MTLSIGPVEQGDGQHVIARCPLLWNGRYVGSLEKVQIGPEVVYQWAQVKLTSLHRDTLLDEVVKALQEEDATHG